MFETTYLSCEQRIAAGVLPEISALHLGVEVLFETTDDLWPQLKWENLLDLADSVAEAGLDASVHAPFHGQNLGSPDLHIREYSLEVLSVSLEVARAFHSPHMVIHSGFLPQFSPKTRTKWLDVFSTYLESLLIRASELNVRIALENTYEKDPSLFEEIFARFPTPMLGMCFDIGHANCFGTVDPMIWPRTFASRIFHIHCSDNDRRDDLHLGLGSGLVDFRPVLSTLSELCPECSVTLEVPPGDALASRDYFQHVVSMIHGKDAQ